MLTAAPEDLDTPGAKESSYRRPPLILGRPRFRLECRCPLVWCATLFCTYPKTMIVAMQELLSRQTVLGS
jgi:hypothetical protein